MRNKNNLSVSCYGTSNNLKGTNRLFCHDGLRNVQFYITCSLIGFTTISAFMLSCATRSYTYAESANAAVTVSSACTMSSNGSSTNSAAIIPGGSEEIVSNPISISCNDGSGYAVYAIGYSNDSYANTDLIASLGTSYNIKTDGSGTYGSNWKMKLASTSNATVSGSYGSYQIIPNSFAKIASHTTSATSSSITPSYQVNISSGQPAGTYTGQVKYVLVHPNTMVAGTYTIAYNANGGSGTMTSTTGIYNFEEQTLPASTFTAPSGYRFAGWCTTNTAGSYACDGTSYAAGATVTGLASAGSTATLYAYWEEIPKIYMQDLTLANCPTTITTVYDKRDGTPYRVQKLADDKCWMLDNLALDLTDAKVQSVMYDSGDANHDTLTNADNTTLGYLFNGGGTTSDQYPTAKLNNVAWTSYSQNYYSIPMMVSSGTCNNASFCVNSPSDGNWSYDAITTATINNVTSVAQGKIGIYYNYCATSAGSYCYGSGTSSTGSPTGDPDTSTLQDVKEDICPKGWRLPTTYAFSGEFQTLYTAYDSNYTNFQTALSTPLSGYFASGVAMGQGLNGSFWSSTWSASGNSYMLYLYVDSSNVEPSSYIGRDEGHSVRCILAE